MAARDGYLVVDKPAGLTSHDVVARARRLLGERRIGHGGTLDPDATGVLVLAVGRATRLLRFVAGLAKVYAGEIVLGVTTSTLDGSGEVLARQDMSRVTLQDARRAAASLTGSIEQVPPMVSALKVGGRRLHELARAGIEVERRPRPVEVYAFELEETAEPGVLAARVECSSGTYVRSLAADLGTALGGGAHLRRLRRLAVGPFSLDEALPLEEVAPERVRPPAGLVAHLDRIVAAGDLAAAVAHGRWLERAEVEASGPGPFAVLGTGGELLALYEPAGANELRPVVVLAESRPLAETPPGRRRTASVVTVGNFDGVHLGHRHLLDRARKVADEAGLPLVAVTFDRHPLATLVPEKVPKLLTGTDHKVELLGAAGADEVVVLAFDQRLADQRAEDFVREVLLGRLGAAAVIVGSNFHFGHRALGNLELLERLAAEEGFVAEGIPLHDEHGAAVSSSRIRSLVAAGDLEEAADLLGRPHELRGRRRPGTDLVEVPAELAVPPDGRYRVEVAAAGAALRPALAELQSGERPPGSPVELVVADLDGAPPPGLAGEGYRVLLPSAALAFGCPDGAGS